MVPFWLSYELFSDWELSCTTLKGTTKESPGRECSYMDPLGAASSLALGLPACCPAVAPVECGAPTSLGCWNEDRCL